VVVFILFIPKERNINPAVARPIQTYCIRQSIGVEYVSSKFTSAGVARQLFKAFYDKVLPAVCLLIK